ncbi:DUF3040 domain-containing protein [Nonomuraea sp. NPDC049309]|uniref:DUF3040 domain-containing protein n=1 Tax=Nonomuraea sp. NPDC049309 TaxID=3364350 RepID=UPI00371CEF88
MHLSDRERRILAEIEMALRRTDRAFARRIDALNAAAGRRRAPRFGHGISRKEIAGLLAAVAVLTSLMVFLVVYAGHASSPAPSRPAPGPSQPVTVRAPLNEAGGG